MLSSDRPTAALCWHWMCSDGCASVGKSRTAGAAEPALRWLAWDITDYKGQP